jgi:hypothetical protein
MIKLETNPTAMTGGTDLGVALGGPRCARSGA